MKFIRHLLSHLMFIMLVGGILSIYYFRYQVLPEGYVNKIDFYAGKVHPALLALSSPQVEGKDIYPYKISTSNEVLSHLDKRDKSLVKEKKHDGAVVTNEDENPGLIEVEVKNSVVLTREDLDTAKIMLAASEVSNKLLKNVGVADKGTEYKPELVADSLQEEKTSETRGVDKNPEMKTISSDNDLASYKDILLQARIAFSREDFKLAVRKYKELILLESYEADFHGELGNVYYAMGNWSMAGNMYYEAALRLIENGQLSQVGYLQRVIQGLNEGYAKKLENRLLKASH